MTLEARTGLVGLLGSSESESECFLLSLFSEGDLFLFDLFFLFSLPLLSPELLLLFRSFRCASACLLLLPSFLSLTGLLLDSTETDRLFLPPLLFDF